MELKPITEEEKDEFNRQVTHIMQSWEWGEFRQTLGNQVLRFGLFDKGKLATAFQITLHPLPFTNYNIGYLPKGPYPNKDLADALSQIAKDFRCVFIKIEPNIPISEQTKVIDRRFKPSPKSMFTKHNFIIDLSRPEEELLKAMHPKTRYNIKIAEKHQVEVRLETSNNAFKTYLNLYFDTTRRQGYFGHNQTYHQNAWNLLKEKDMARLLIAYYQGQPITAWMLFNFKDTLYYPYGGSSQAHKQVMANNLVAWEAIRLGKKLGLKFFDLWGALGPNPDPKDPFIGFHRFKAGYGGQLVEYLGTFDLVTNPTLYHIFNLFNKSTKLKATLLKVIGK